MPVPTDRDVAPPLSGGALDGTSPHRAATSEILRLLLADREALALTLDRFAGAFTALSGLLGAAPDADLLARVRDPELLADWPMLEATELSDPDLTGPDHAFAPGRRGAALLHESAVAGEQETEIRRDYNRLFFGPGPMLAPPYESVHRSDEHLVFDRETIEVRAAYAAFDLAAPRLNKEPDDHLGLELAFLGALCVRALDAIDAADDAELSRLLEGVQSFLDEHLLAWGPACLTQAESGAETLFYRGVAALGLGTLEHATITFLPA